MLNFVWINVNIQLSIIKASIQSFRSKMFPNKTNKWNVKQKHISKTIVNSITILNCTPCKKRNWCLYFLFKFSSISLFSLKVIKSHQIQPNVISTKITVLYYKQSANIFSKKDADLSVNQILTPIKNICIELAEWRSFHILHSWVASRQYTQT